MSIKAKCGNCQKVVKAPSKYAGKRVKCPGCQKSIDIPASASSTTDDGGLFDLNSLAAIENGAEAIMRDIGSKPMTHKEAQAAAAAAKAAEYENKTAAIDDPTIRICPQCGSKAKNKDIYIELICSHCGGGIPGYETGEKTVYTSANAGRLGKGISFYSGFTGALGYPIRAIPAIISAAGIATLAIVVPLLGVLGFTKAASLNPASNYKKSAEEIAGGDAWVGIFLLVAFLAEGLYFGAIAYYASIDTIRATTANNEQAPGLTWNPINIGAALAGYVVLMALFAGVIIGLTGGLPTTPEDFDSLMQPWKLILLGLMMFAVPMNLIGLSSSHAIDGLNAKRVGKSIGRLIGHYTFLFLVFLIYMGLNIGVIVAIMSWAAPAIATAATEGLSAGIGKVLGGVAAWGVVIGAGFYMAYSIGRVLGLFSRTYRERIDFEL